MSGFTVNEWHEVSRVEIMSARDPISLQASAHGRARFKADLAAAVAGSTTGIFTRDVEVTIVWYVSEQLRYGKHMVADIDNIVKPILDAVTGPDGLMIDDNQVQSLRVSWIDPYDPMVKFRLSIEALEQDEYLEREGLFFVEFSPERCFPMFGNLPPQAIPMFVQYLDELLRGQEELVASGMGGHAKRFLPVQRFFPRNRLGRFTVRPSTDFL